LNGPHEDKSYAQHKWTVSGEAGRWAHQHPNDNYEQPRALFRKVFNDEERKTVIENIGGSLKDVRMDIKERMIQHFYKIDHEYGAGIAKIIGLPVQKSKL
jgi:catalase